MNTKLCNHCHLIKPLDDFVIGKDRKDGHRNICKACARAYWANRTEIQRERTRVRYRIWRQSHREQTNAATRRWAKRNLAYLNEKAKKWQKTPQGRYSVLKKHARKRGIPVLLNRSEFIQWFTNQPMYCHYCKQELHIDEPRNLNIERKNNDEGYSLDNITLSCWRCNRVKGDILTEEEMLAIARNHFLPQNQ